MLTPENDETYEITYDFECDDCLYQQELRLTAYGNRYSSYARIELKCPNCDAEIDREIDLDAALGDDDPDYFYETARDEALAWA